MPAKLVVKAEGKVVVGAVAAAGRGMGSSAEVAAEAGSEAATSAVWRAVVQWAPAGTRVETL